METKLQQKGMTLLEILVTLSVVSIVVVAAATVFVDTSRFNRRISDQLDMTGDARRALKTIIAEVRTTSPSSLGAYPLVQTATSSFIFYSNIDDDAYKERVRYYRSGTSLMRGIVKPSGNPLVYDTNTEIVTQLAKNVVNASTTPIFSYYDNTYSGTQPSLSGSFNIASVRLVKVELIIGTIGTSTENAHTFTSQISMRNLKDNL